MKRLVLLFIYICSIYSSYSNIDTTAKKPYWTPVGALGLNISQMSFSNWSQGGDALFAWSANANLGLVYQDSLWRFANRIKLAYGITKTGDGASAQTKVNDNEIYIENLLSYNMGWAVDPYASNTFRSVLDKGYDYKQTPVEQISGFLDPGYIVQSVGFTYNRYQWLIARLGVGFQETFADSFAVKYTDDPATAKLEKFKFDTGIESVFEGKFLIDSNVAYVGNLRLFTKFDQLDVWDIRFDNMVTAKISKYFNVNLNALVIYERKTSPYSQVKQALQLGVVYNLF